MHIALHVYIHKYRGKYEKKRQRKKDVVIIICTHGKCRRVRRIPILLERLSTVNKKKKKHPYYYITKIFVYRIYLRRISNT